ncbi:MAG: formate--tetrahydrofolate ligase [Clostridia bacterium]|nr:formate--tetrahydrofolate ligase [Clostridia bacterium]
MKSDIQIAREAKLQPIEKVAARLNIARKDLHLYGDYMAKVRPATGKGKLILVTAINPTAAGEGKTTVSIGLADAMQRIGCKVALALREPSLGPVFGIKGGATGGGYAQIAPMDDINLHFTGDLHAITAANNLLAAMVDNHVYFGNELGIERVTFHRCLDMNDRALRFIRCGLKYNDRDDSFDITAASEVMAALCLSRDAADLKERLGNITVGYTKEDAPVYCRDLHAQDAMAILLKDAVQPNLVQTLEGVPAFVHGGPFANIAHGCNSITATRTAMHYADYAVTEAGFGADLGAEKFLDIKCRAAGIAPDAVVVVATVRALKCAGGKQKEKLSERDDAALTAGIGNLLKHVENVTGVYNRKCVVAINRFVSDEDQEIRLVEDACRRAGVDAVCVTVWGDGGKGGILLAEKVKALCALPDKPFTYCYDLEDSVTAKIEAVAKRIYGAADVEFAPAAQEALRKIAGTPWEKFPVCIAKTQYSLSDDPALLGRPQGFTLHIRDLTVRTGAGFIVALSGDILLMPGLSKTPAAVKMHIDEKGIIEGLF